ncbi:hypothetical protein NEUTE1DRAFT_102038 [Neurospora tetrasperma FGSC 2508]|uniref:Uncharacterized protein n=1 Tax=Neurospora tetrasperma (strain FGSC 2508 / ATCC MYA-4615 / P0657) TaxID=510951 RepID=F8MQZ1_NEUT8|nr:uncharacterized protein NEUTE1DRAFT_102038 [Neurospora tetrasperma FGSC 2508]EGO56771.1 hypothetical protein NEUTE1DRAFT_102038 [Neurospora tetrasperma FGSC 2508]EGZ70343.1 hypothetical protein NEUTE2DRAFT_130349 [Neurospora tetrasperma FGSC 2509]
MSMSLAPGLQESHGLNKSMPPGLLLYIGYACLQAQVSESPPTIMVTVRPLVRQLGPSDVHCEPANWPDRPVTAIPIHVAIPNLNELLEEFGVGQVPILPSYHDSPRILALASPNHNSTLSRVMIKSEDCTAALGSLLGDNRHQTGGLVGKPKLKFWDLLFFRSFVLLFPPPSSLLHVVVHFLKQYNDNDNSDYNDKSRKQLLLAEAYPITMSQLFCYSGAIALLFPVGYSPTTTSASSLCWDSLPNKFAKLVNQTCISFPFRAPNVQHDKEQLPAHVPLQLVKLFEITHRAQYSYSPVCVSPVYLAFATTALYQIFSSNPLFSRILAASCHSIHHPHRTRQRVVVRIPLAKIRVIAAEACNLHLTLASIQSMHPKQAFKIREIRKRSTQG